MGLSFYKKLTLLFITFFIGIAVLGFLAYRNNVAYTNSTKLVEHTQQVLDESEKIFSLTQSISNGERGYIITGDSDFLQPLITARQKIFVQIGKIKTLTADNPVQQIRIDSINLFAQKRMDVSDQIISALNNSKKDEAVKIIFDRTVKNLSLKVRELVTELQDLENSLLKVRKASIEARVDTTNHLLLVLFAALLLALTGAYYGFLYNHRKHEKLESDVQTSNHFLNAILENIPNMIFVKDAKELRFITFNRAGEKLLGRFRDELLGKNDFDFFPKEQAEGFITKDREVLLKGEVIDIKEEAIQTKSGEKWLHTKKIAITDQTGKPQYLLGISEDITNTRKHIEEVKKLNQELEKTVNQLLSANKEMEAFTYSVSHDLRAPLRIIDGFGEILLKDYNHALDDEGRRTLEVIIGNAKHMGQLIDDLLNLSRLGRTQLTLKKVDMREMVDDVIHALSMMDTQFGKSEIKVNVLSPSECDANLMRQVWINLISNAVKYSRKNEKPQIEIGSENNNGRIVYYVKDNGVGFSMKYYSKLFGVFQRLHKVSEFEGTGVGLALVHRIVIKHGGLVWADAIEGKGASFYFTLS